MEQAVARRAKEKYVLKLYITGMTARSQQALRNIKKIIKDNPDNNLDLEVIDIYQQPTLAKGDQIIAVPTLIKKLPAPLRRLIDRYIGDEEVARIAAEARKGRRLLVATTDLDAARPVVWDLTKIAASGAPNARQLIGDVILASCSVPGLFRPVLLEVAAGGDRYDELHVDGGVTSQLFVGPHGFDWEGSVVRLGVPDKPQVYVIRNARLRPLREAARNNLERTIAAVSRNPGGPPEWKEVELKITPIIRRSLASMAREPGIDEVYRRYVAAYGDTLDFNFAHIPDDLDLDPAEFIDLDYMRELFARGYEMARSGYPWIRGAP